MSSRHQAVLAIFFEEGVTTLSPAHLAYRMGVPVREAEALLDEMVKEDLLSLDFSGDHDFGYRLPPGTLPPSPQTQPSSESPSYASQPNTWQGYNPAPGERISYHPPNHAPASGQRTWYKHPPEGYGAGSDYRGVDHGWANHHAPAQHQTAKTAPDGTDGSLGPVHAAPTAFAEAPSPNRWQASPLQPATHRPPVRSTELVPFHDNLPEHHTQTDRKPFVAGLLSFLVTGLGQVYNGEPLKGGLMFATSAMMWLFMMGWVISMWSIADAYVVAQRTETQGT